MRGFHSIAGALALLSLAAGGFAAPTPSAGRAPAQKQGAAVRMMGLPLSFEPNRGQFDPRVRFKTRAGGSTVFLTDREAVMVLPGRPIGAGQAADDPERVRRGPGAVLRMRLVGAAKAPRSAGALKLPGVVNYLIGSDAKRWRTDIPTYEQARFTGVYPGTDLVYYGSRQRLEYDFVLRPGADPRRIRLAFEGAARLRVAASGDLIATTGAGDVSWKRPYAYQMHGDRRVQVACDYSLAPGARAVGFRLARYDASRPLVVDPVLFFSTYQGGTGDDYGYGIAVDANGAAYMAGYSSSTGFPTTAGAFQTTSSSAPDAIVTKLNAAGSAAAYSTYLGGSSSDAAYAIAVDSSGAAYITGYTASTNFPTTPGAFQTSGGGTQDVFVAKLNAAGSGLSYSTYFHAVFGNDRGYAIAVDSAGAAYVAGSTTASDFPTTAGAAQTVINVSPDAFVAKVNPAGSALTYSTYLGGSLSD